MNKAEKQITKDIKKYGSHLTHVFDPEDSNPCFTYSTGLLKSYKAPELIIMGLRHEVAPSLINIYQDAVDTGERFEAGVYYEGFLDNFKVTFGQVSQAVKEKYMLSSCWFNDGCEFPALQLIYPSTDDVWPWEETASEYFKKAQPSLADKAHW